MHKHAPVLQINRVTKSWHGTAAVDDLSLAVNAGEIFGFLGPNGAGKTTTIKLVLDVLRPTSGTIELFGTSSQHTRETHRRIGYLSGDMALDEDLTGQQYLGFVASSYGANYDKRVRELADELQADLRVKIGNYSRGNKQKIGLIAAMMHQPELLILDEPSSGFDPLMQDVFVRLIREFQAAGGTAFISSHSLGEVQKLCERVAFLRAGKLVGITDIDELNRTAAKRLQVVAAEAEIARMVDKAGALAGLQPISRQVGRASFTYAGTVRPLLKFCAAYDIDDLTITEPELEDVFMKYYETPAAADKPPGAAA